MDTTPRPTPMLAAVLVLVVGSAIVPLSAPALADHENDPRFEAYVPEPVVTPGSTGRLTVQLVNDHEAVDESVETAREVEVRVASGDTPIEVRSGPRFLGAMEDGVFRSVSVSISVPRDIEAGTYDLPIEISYVYEGDETATTTVHATVRVNERARFEIVSTETDLSIGESGALNVTLENVGSATAHGATVTLESRSTAVRFGTATSATRFVGTWAPGERRTVSYDLAVGRDAERQRYALTARVSYEDEDGAEAVSRSLATGFVPGAEQSFDVRNVSSTLQVGHEGTLSGTIVNLGPNAVRGAVVEFVAENPNLKPLETEYPVGDLAPGEAARFRFPAMTAANSGEGLHQFTVRVRYRDRGEEVHRSEDLDVATEVARAQSFGVEGVSSTLRVGDEGTISGRIVNRGPMPVRNAVVVFADQSGSVTVFGTEFAVGDLAPGEAASFSFDAEIGESADAGPRQFSVRVRYRDDAGDVYRSDPIDLAVSVADKRDTFDVSAVNATIEAGASGTLTLRVRNTGNATVTDVSAKLFANAPLGSGDDEAFIDRLGPGESAEVVFGLSASAAALAEKTYPVSVDFQYDDEDGDTLLSDTYRIPVRVTEPTGGNGPPVVPIAAVALAAVVVIGAGAYLYRRRGQ